MLILYMVTYGITKKYKNILIGQILYMDGSFSGRWCMLNKSVITNQVNFESVENLAKNFNGKIVFSTCSVYGAGIIF